MTSRTPFPPVFWVANGIEVLERFAYYGIYLGFGIYMEYLGYTRAQLGFVQSLFLFCSYVIPLVSGTLADRYGFKKVLIVSYLAYLPSVLLLILTRSFSGIALSMLSIGLAAGIFKPLISGTIRTVTDPTNKTLGFGVFYAMVNIGASFGPVVAGRLRAISWNYAFLAAAISIGLMLIITLLFYHEPRQSLSPVPLKSKLAEIGVVLGDVKFLTLLILIGLFFWLPLWAFFNLLAVYVDRNLDTVVLYQIIRSVFGSGVAGFLSRSDANGVRHLIGETIAHTGYIIMILQVPVSRLCEKRRALPTFAVGLGVAAAGFALIGLAYYQTALIFLGIIGFAVGEMIASPRIQEYITWIAPQEKAGLYMGTNYLAIGIGGTLSGVVYTSLYGALRAAGRPQTIWFILAANMLAGIAAIWLFLRKAGEFKELER